MLAIALVFFRLFPQIIRFISGESKLLVYSIGYVLVIVLGMEFITDIFTDDVSQWGFVAASTFLLAVSLIVFAVGPGMKSEIVAVFLSAASLLVLLILVPDKVKVFSFELSWVFYVVPAMMVIFILARQGYSLSLIHI